MRPPTRRTTSRFASPLLIGMIAIAVIAGAVYISYNANTGIPLVATKKLHVNLPDAANLQVHADVRIGGARVGQVKEITAMRARRPGHRPTVRVTLALDKGIAIPVDTTVSVAPASILGAKYVAIAPGKASRTVPDGGTLPLSQARVAVELSDTFNLFDKPTTRGLQGTVTGLGDALAGRGEDLNDTIGAVRELLGPLNRVLAVIQSQRGDLAGLIRGAATTSGALAPVARSLVSLLDHASRTLAAIDAADPSLGQAIDELPAFEGTSTRALGHLLPVLSDAATLARAIRPGTHALPATARALAQSFETARPVLTRTPGALAGLPTTFARIGQASGPARSALDQLLPAISSLQNSLETLVPAQVNCNAGGLFFRNVDSTFSDGGTAGSWGRVVLTGVPLNQSLQEPKPAPDAHIDYNPHENATECEAGNEPYAPGQLIGNPPGQQANTTDRTDPPAGVTELAVKAGVLPPGSKDRP